MHVVKSFLIAIALHLITQVFFVTHANASYYNTCVFQVQIKETGKVDPDLNPVNTGPQNPSLSNWSLDANSIRIASKEHIPPGVFF